MKILKKSIRSILKKNCIYIDSGPVDEILTDAISDAHYLCLKKFGKIEKSIKRKKWICYAAANRFMHYYKDYKRFDYYEPDKFSELFADCTAMPDNNGTEEQFIERFSPYCNKEELYVLVQHWQNHYTLKEISEQLNINYKTLTKQHERLLARLKKCLPPPKELIYCNMKIFCRFLFSKREYIV